MSGDQRLFTYPLDPQLQRLRWRLDAQLAVLATVLAEAEALRGALASLAREAADGGKALASAQSQRMDPVQARHALDFLAAIHGRHAAMARDVETAEQRASEQRVALAATQAEVDGLERDRGECLADHLGEADRRSQRDADQDWTARTAWQARDGASAEVEA